jgi:hypothetical protein
MALGVDDKNIVGPLVFAFLVQVWRGLKEARFPPPRAFLGLAVATVMIVGLAQFAPDVAQGFAWLLLIAVLFGAFGGEVQGA